MSDNSCHIEKHTVWSIKYWPANETGSTNDWSCK